MKKIVTQDVLNAVGEVRFQAGIEYDYPKTVWDQIAVTLDMPLHEFTKDPAVADGPMKTIRRAAQTNKRVAPRSVRGSVNG